MQTDPLPSKKSAIRTVIWAGLVAGTLDVIAAIVIFLSTGGKDPVLIFKFIASGIFGQAAFAEGSAMTVWGICFHFSIALIFAAFFFLIYPQIRRFIRNPVAIGLLYGLLIWLVMTRIILPLSNTPVQPFDPVKAIIGMVVLMVLVGLPIALIVHKHYLES